MDQVKVGVGVVVVKDNKVLVGVRKGSHGAGQIAFPGGHLEITDSTFQDCARREVLEETGINVEVVSVDGYRDDLFTTYDILSADGSKRYVTSYLLAKYIDGGEIIDENFIAGKEQDKCEKWQWVTLSQLDELVSGENVWIPKDKVINYLRTYLQQVPEIVPFMDEDFTEDHPDGTEGYLVRVRWASTGTWQVAKIFSKSFKVKGRFFTKRTEKCVPNVREQTIDFAKKLWISNEFSGMFQDVVAECREKDSDGWNLPVKRILWENGRY